METTHFELMKEKITVDKRTEVESSQSLIEGDILAPDVKPDIMKVLKVDARTCIEKTEVSSERVSYQGRLELDILYLSKDTDKAINHMSGTIGIDDFVNLDGLLPEMTADISAEVSHIEFRLINDRKINVKAVVETVATAFCVTEKEIVCGISGICEAQTLKKPVKLTRMLESREEKFIIKEELQEPSGKPNIREIINCCVEIANKETRALDGKVSVKGDVIVKTLFLGDTDGAACEYMEHEIPFSGFIDAPYCQDGLFADATLKISDKYVQISQDSDGEDRAIEVELAISACVKVYSDTVIDMLEDAYSINKRVNLMKESIKCPKIICRNKNQFPVRETIVFPDGTPKVMQVYSIYGKNKVDRIEIEDERAIIEGVVDAVIIYVDESEEQSLCSHNAVIPFRQSVDIKGAKDGMNVSVDYSISHSSFNMLSGSEIEARFVLDTLVSVTDDKDIELVIDAVVDDCDKDFIESIPSLAVYIAAHGDTLWKIAKKYNTAIEDLTGLNELDNDGKIYPGQKLLILKKRIE